MKTLELTQEQAFEKLVEMFGRRPKSHLFPIWNYFFIPQTKAQFKTWSKSCNEGIASQNLLYSIEREEQFEVLKAFCPTIEKHYTKSKMIRVKNFDALIQEVKKFVK
jgi:hypothetical protein